MFGFLSSIGKIAGGFGTLIGSTKKKEKQPTPRENILSQAQGAREAAEEYGFNPLTMLQYGQPGGATPIAGGGGTPPLASIEAITGGLMDINDVVSGDAARRRAAEQAQLDLAQIKLDQAQAGVIAAGPGVGPIASTPSPLGRNAVPVATSGGATFQGGSRLGLGERPPVHPFARPIEMIPVRDIDGAPREIPKQIADRLDIQPFGQMIAEDVGALFGDEVGQVIALPQMPGVFTYSTTGEPVRPVFSPDPYGDQRRSREEQAPKTESGETTAERMRRKAEKAARDIQSRNRALWPF